MNDTLIDLYRGVQKYRGEWQQLDPVLYHGELGIIVAIYDDVVDVMHKDGMMSCVSYDDPDLIWLPPIYSEDGRCLWKMVDWERFDVQVEDAGYVMVSSFSNVPWGHPICAPRPLPEALLRAIREQEAGK